MPDVKDKAVADGKAAKLYAKLAEVHAQVFAERGPKRVAAINLAGDLITLGYSLRGAAKAAGQKPDNKLQRYFEVARAMVNREENPQAPDSIAPPDGFGTWLDAIAAMPLDGMAQHIRDTKAGRKPEPTADPDKAIRAAVNSALGKLAGLVAGEASGKCEGFALGEAQLGRYLKAFVAAGFKVDGPTMDKLPLTALTVEAKSEVQTIAGKVAEMLGQTPAPVPAVVNG